MGTHEARGRKEKRKEVVVVKKDRGEGARVSFVPSFLSLRIAPRPTFPHSFGGITGTGDLEQHIGRRSFKNKKIKK